MQPRVRTTWARRHRRLAARPAPRPVAV